MKLPFEEKFGQLAASRQRFDLFSHVAIHILLATEPTVRFFPGSGVPLALWQPLGTAGDRPEWVLRDHPSPRLHSCPAQPSQLLCQHGQDTRAWGQQHSPSRVTCPIAGLGVHLSSPAVSRVAPAHRAAPTPAAPCPCPALGPGLLRCFIPPLICPSCHKPDSRSSSPRLRMGCVFSPGPALEPRCPPDSGPYWT